MNSSRKAAMSRFLVIGYGLLLAISFGVFTGTAFANEWLTDSKSGCKVWNPNPIPEESFEWSGACDKNGLATGKGTLQKYLKGKPTDYYDGEYRDGKMNGSGTYTWNGHDEYKNMIGIKYVGEYKDNDASGMGKQIVPKTDEAMIAYMQSKTDIKAREDGEFVIFEGLFLDGEFEFTCTSQEQCEIKKNELQAEIDNEKAEKERLEKQEKQDLYQSILSYITLGIFLITTPWIILRKKLAIFKIISNTMLARAISILIMFWFLAFVQNASSSYIYSGFDGFKDLQNILYYLLEPIDILFEIATYPEMIFPIIAYLLLILGISFVIKRRKSKAN